MNTETLKITHNRETSFEFELNVTGISTESAIVRFMINVMDSFSISFLCVHGDENKWNVTIPPLDNFMEEGNHTFTIEMIAEGFYFAPVKGTAEVGAIAEVNVSIPQNNISVTLSDVTNTSDRAVKDSKPTTKKKSENNKPPKKQKPLDTNESIISQLNRDLVGNGKDSVIKSLLKRI